MSYPRFKRVILILLNMAAKNWVFVLNNYIDEEINFLKTTDIFNYIIFGKEVGEQGTPHLQGYIQLPKKQKRSYLQKINKRIHWEIARGDVDSQLKYCGKEDKNPFIKGTPTKKGQRTDLLICKELIKKNTGELEIAEEHFNTWCKNYKAFARYRTLVSKRELHKKLRVYVLWGPAGSGKTKKAYALYPNIYSKNETEYWDGYDGQKEVLFDDFYGNIPWGLFLKLLDRYPILLNQKGTTYPAMYDTVVITSNTHPRFWYSKLFLENKASYYTLERRLSLIMEVD